MATVPAQRTDAAGTPASYQLADVAGDDTAYDREVVIHVKNGNAGTSEVQGVAITGGPTGGTFKLALTDPFTGLIGVSEDIPYNVTTQGLEDALGLISTIGPGNVDVTGGGPFTVTFGVNRAGQSLPLLSLVNNALTPSGNVVVTQTTDGGGQITVHVDSPKPCDQGFYHDQIVVVPANSDRHIGPFTTRFNQGDNTIQWTYSAVTNVKVAVLRVAG